MIAPARRAAYATLLAVAANRRHLDDALAHERPTLADRRDVGLLTELATGTLRWQSRLDYELEPLVRQPLARLDPEVAEVLRLGAYQLRHLTRVPAAAVVHDAVALVRSARKSSAAGLVNAVLRRLSTTPARELPARPAETDHPLEAWVRHLAVAYAHPAWLVERWIARLGVAVTEARLAFDNTPAGVTLRVARGTPTAALAAELAAEGVETTPCRHAVGGLDVVAGDAGRAAAVVSGRCVMQDEGSQLIGDLAPIVGAARVLDLCAAPGSKALQYLERSGPEGLVVACDVRPRRVAQLAARLADGAAGRHAVVRLDAASSLPFQPAFDVVALDAPCTGLGSLRRNPDIKWRRTAQDVDRYAALQGQLLARAAEVVRPGGAIVYSTCSTEPEENVDVVARFLAAMPAFTSVEPPAAVRQFAIAGVVVLTPEGHGLEGYGGAVLVRTAGR